MSEEELSTLDAELIEVATNIEFFEVRVSDHDGFRSLPFLSEELEFQLGKNTATLQLHSSGVVNVQCGALSSDLHIGEVLETAQWKLSVVDLRSLPPFWLVGLSPELTDKRWEVRYGTTKLGRRGSRNNDITLAHPSISRNHATIEASSHGSSFRSESSALSALNGKLIEPQQEVKLAHRDLLQLGEWHFQWQREEKALQYSPGILKLEALGRERTMVDDRLVKWHNEKGKDLLYRLAYSRSTISIERLVEEYWPERPTLRQRKNLSHVFKGLQSDLGLTSEKMNDLLPRTKNTIRLNLERVVSCDFWDLKDDCRQDDFGKLTEYFRGTFLPSSSRAWIVAARRDFALIGLSSLKKLGAEQSAQNLLADAAARIARETPYDSIVLFEACELLRDRGFSSLADGLIQESSEML